MPLTKTLLRPSRSWWMQTALRLYPSQSLPGSTTMTVTAMASQSHSMFLFAHIHTPAAPHPALSYPLLLPSVIIRHLQSAPLRNSTSPPVPVRQRQRHYSSYSSPTSSHTTAATATIALDAASTPQTSLKIINPRKDDNGIDMLLTITPRAVERLHHLMATDNPTCALRITVEAGGCQGFQYLLSLANLPSHDLTSASIDPEDTVFEQDGAKIIIDESSLQLLKGSKVDYTMDLIGRQFKVVDGPSVKSSCGCGTSFDVKI